MIRNRLAELLAERSLKISRVAAEIPNLSRNTITSTAQNSGKMIQLETVDKLCQYLQIKPDDFFEYVPFDIEYKCFLDNVDHYINDSDSFSGLWEEGIKQVKGSFFVNVKSLDKTFSNHMFELEFKTNSPYFLKVQETIDGPETIEYHPLELSLVDVIDNSSTETFFNFLNKKIPAGFRSNILNDIQRNVSASVGTDLLSSNKNYDFTSVDLKLSFN